MKIIPAKRSIQFLAPLYMRLNFSIEKTQATKAYQTVDIKDIRHALIKPIWNKTSEGMVAAHRLATKAADFGFERLVKSPGL